MKPEIFLIAIISDMIFDDNEICSHNPGNSKIYIFLSLVVPLRFLHFAKYKNIISYQIIFMWLKANLFWLYWSEVFPMDLLRKIDKKLTFAVESLYQEKNA